MNDTMRRRREAQWEKRKTDKERYGGFVDSGGKNRGGCTPSIFTRTLR
jgi:hypothetical protein